MTCIVGLESKGRVFIGGDSAGTAGNMTQRTRNDKKVFVREDFIFGYAGSFRMGQLLQHNFVIPKFEGGSVQSFMVNQFVDSLRDCLQKEKLRPECLVGFKGKLFDVGGDYQIGEVVDGFDSIGSGSDLALGAMHVTKHVKDPKSRIEQALHVSSLNNAAVRPPYIVLSV